MLDAKAVAQQLAQPFLSHGNYTFASTKRADQRAGVSPAATGGEAVDELLSEGFAGLAVQSVGYEEGAENPRVHVYIVKGSRRRIASISDPNYQVEVEVNRMGKLMVRPEQASSATNQGNVFVRKKRVACGSSCAPSAEQYAGTFGALVRKKASNDMYVLSNNHVLAACNHVPVGMPILAPGNMDGRPGERAPGEIARHSEICALASGEPALVPPCREDVAIARVVDPALVTSWQGDISAGYDTPGVAASPVSGMRVKKFGRTTGMTTGTIEALINTPTAIPYRATHFTATVWLIDVWTIRADGGRPFALPGDSGSLVVTEDGAAAVGLVFAPTPQGDYGWIVPMTHILTLFGGITLATKHGL
jgi:hypothetical protein